MIDFATEKARWDASNARIAQLVAAGARPLRFSLKSGAAVLVSRDLARADAKKDDAWRVTHFDSGGSPTGHIGPTTFERALVEARRMGADLLEAVEV